MTHQVVLDHEACTLKLLDYMYMAIVLELWLTIGMMAILLEW